MISSIAAACHAAISRSSRSTGNGQPVENSLLVDDPIQSMELCIVWPGWCVPLVVLEKQGQKTGAKGC